MSIFAVSSKKVQLLAYTLAISVFTEPILIIFANNVATISPLYIFESELLYSNPFLLNEGHFAIMPTIGCHSNVP